jgi:hypothetical protein
MLLSSMNPCFNRGMLVALVLAVGAMGDDLAKEKAAFEAADKALNKEWAVLEKKCPEHVWPSIKSEQRSWIEYRDYVAEAAGNLTEEDVDFWGSQAEMTRSRIEFLKAWVAMETDGAGNGDWSGRYSDGYGGTLYLSQDDEGLYFAVDVVRGPTFHLGSLSGKAKVNGMTAFFTDEDRLEEEGKEEETWLIFRMGTGEDSRIEVNGENTMYYHGARAYFDGKYVKLDDLTDEEEEALSKGEVPGMEP